MWSPYTLNIMTKKKKKVKCFKCSEFQKHLVEGYLWYFILLLCDMDLELLWDRYEYRLEQI